MFGCPLSALLVLVAVMKVRVVRMAVPEPVVPVPVRMRLGDHAFVGVLMMGIVDVAVFVLDRLVRVGMLMAFGQMQPEAKSHQRAGEGELGLVVHQFCLPDASFP